MAVVLIGTLDTKGIEFQFVRDLIQRAGIPTLVIDAGVTQPPAFQPDVNPEDVFRAAGTTLDGVVKAGDSGSGD